MSSTRRFPKSQSAVLPLRSATCLVVALGMLALLGCSDHRVSLHQFLDATQPPAANSPQPGLPASADTQAASQPAAPLTALPESAQTSQPSDRFMGPYRIGPGDLLTIHITAPEQPNPIQPVFVRVDRDGFIDLPGRVQVAGLEFQDAEKAIQAALVPTQYRQAAVNVELVKAETATVMVSGAVTQPGLVQLPRTQRNLLYAIAGAGGISYTASGEVTLRRLRNPGQTMTFNLLLPDQLQQALVAEPLQNGDVVLVQAAQPNTIFVGGLVMLPHAQVNPPGTTMNVLQALASAGGLRTDVSPTELTLIRRMPDGKDIHAKLDVQRIQQGLDPNLTLAPGDIVWVPDTALTRVQDWVNKNIFFRAGFNVVGTYSAEGVDYLNSNARQAAQGTNNNVQNTVDPLGFLTKSSTQTTSTK